MVHPTKTLLRSSCITALLVVATGCDMSMDLDFGDMDACAMGCGGWDYPSIPFETLPTPVAGGLAFTAIAAGGTHTCGITSNGTWCWGDRDNGTAAYQQVATPQPVPGAEAIVRISAGNALTCGHHADGRTLCWGLNTAGEAGTGVVGPSWTPTPVKSPLALASVNLSSSRQYGRGHACSVTADGAAYCWGDNALGQLGNGTTQASLVPVPVTGNHVFESIAVGAQLSCGVVRGGDAYCWGQGSGGQLGADPQEVGNCGTAGSGAFLPCTRVPRRVSGSVKFTTVAVGDAFACGLDLDGRAHCWGANFLGQLGDGTSLLRYTPTRIADSQRFTAIDAGAASTCALTADRDIICWGANGLGQLGDGTTLPRLAPAKVASTAAFSAITVGDDHACALAVSGAAYCWGANDAMKLGKGS